MVVRLFYNNAIKCIWSGLLLLLLQSYKGTHWSVGFLLVGLSTFLCKWQHEQCFLGPFTLALKPRTDATRILKGASVGSQKNLMFSKNWKKQHIYSQGRWQILTFSGNNKPFHSKQLTMVTDVHDFYMMFLHLIRLKHQSSHCWHFKILSVNQLITKTIIQ